MQLGTQARDRDRNGALLLSPVVALVPMRAEITVGTDDEPKLKCPENIVLLPHRQGALSSSSSLATRGRYPRDVAPFPGHRDDEAQGVELGLVGSTQRRAAHLLRRLHVRLHGIEVADGGVGVIFVGLQGLHYGRAR